MKITFEDINQWLWEKRRIVILIASGIMFLSSICFYLFVNEKWNKYFAIAGTVASIAGIVIVLWQLDQIASKSEIIKSNTEHIKTRINLKGISRLILKINYNIQSMIDIIDLDNVKCFKIIMQNVKYDLKSLIRHCELLNKNEFEIFLSSLRVHLETIKTINSDLTDVNQIDNELSIHLAKNLYGVVEDLESFDVEFNIEGYIYE